MNRDTIYSPHAPVRGNKRHGWPFSEYFPINCWLLTSVLLNYNPRTIMHHYPWLMLCYSWIHIWCNIYLDNDCIQCHCPACVVGSQFTKSWYQIDKCLVYCYLLSDHSSYHFWTLVVMLNLFTGTMQIYTDVSFFIISQYWDARDVEPVTHGRQGPVYPT